MLRYRAIGGAQCRQFAKGDQDGERESRYEQDNG